jgi:hypothetical protein
MHYEHTDYDADNYYDDNYSEETEVLQPSALGSVIIVVATVLSFFNSQSATTPADMAKVIAVGVGLALVINLLLDYQKGLRNFFRADTMCLIAIYALTVAEFLSPQEEFNSRMTLDQASMALNVICIGFVGLTLGRHLIAPIPMKADALRFSDVSDTTLFYLFSVASILGYLYILMSVDFDLIRLFNELLEPRFHQSWGRGRLGGWNSLLTELALFQLIIPPLSGIIINRRQTFGNIRLLIVFAIFLGTVFQGFAGGSRNVYVAHLATFLLAYLLTLSRNTLWNTIIPVSLSTVLLLVGSYHMLEFRTIGLRDYVENRVYETDAGRDTLAVDYNLAPLGLLIDTFPGNGDFLGSEVIVWALIKPIPRAFWPGKPEGLSVSIEESVGAGEGYTVAATYLGESYMMAGKAGVFFMSVFFGALAAWWNRLAAQRHSDYAMVVYALGFFVAVITMRSMFWLTTIMLPIVALIAFKNTLLKR